MHGLPRRVEGGALLGTIPAFYLAMLSSQRILSAALYLLAFVACAFMTWTDTVAARKHPASTRERHGQRQLGALLSVFLLLSAVLPQGDQPDLLILRLGTAAL